MSGKDDERRLSPGCLAKILGPLIWAFPVRGDYQSLPEQTVGANNLFAGLEAATTAWLASLWSSVGQDRDLTTKSKQGAGQPARRTHSDDMGDTDVRNYQ